MNIVEALEDRELLGAAFPELGPWRPWLVALRALFGLPLEDQELEIFRRCTGREEAPTSPCREGWFIVGRRGGKSRVAALIAVFLACFRDYTKALAPGEKATVMLIAANRKQARVAKRYCEGVFDSAPMLGAMVSRRTAGSIQLEERRVEIEIHAAKYRTVRAYSLAGIIADEVAYWQSDDSANPDTEVMNALRPAMATLDGKLIAISSPYARRGELWKAYQKRWGKPGPVLVWKADSRTMNPELPAHVVEEAYEEDPDAAAAEWGAEFRRDVETYVSKEVLEACTPPGRIQLPPRSDVEYVGFVDPSGGAQDSFTLGIAHCEPEPEMERVRVVLDMVLERKAPFSPESVVEEFAATLRDYRISGIRGDRYAGEWPREQFEKRGITYDPGVKVKSDLYRELLPLLNSSRVELLDQARLLAQFGGLERRVSRGGKDSIDHSPGGKDDVANAAAGALVTAATAGIHAVEDILITSSGEVDRGWREVRPLGRDRLSRRSKWL